MAILALVLLPGLGRAEDEARARGLFQRGRQLLAVGQTDAACEAFQQSTDEYSSSSGSWLNLALCREKQGKLASAWSAYARAGEVAERGGDARKAAAARQFAEGLEPKLPRLTIAVPVRVLGQLVRVDGATVASDEWGAGVPVDPGEHLVEVSAPRYSDWSTRVTIGAARERAEVVVPRLEPLPGTEPARPAGATGADDGGDGGELEPEESASDDEPTTTAAIALFATGGVAIAVGAACGIASLVLQSDYEAAPTLEGAEQGEQVTLAADVSFIVGLAAASAGLIVLLVGGEDEPSGVDADGLDARETRRVPVARRVRLAPVGPGGGVGATVFGAF